MYEALAAEIGFVVKVSDIALARSYMYKVRKERAPVFDSLTFIVSPFVGTGEIWIMKKGPANAQDTD